MKGGGGGEGWGWEVGVEPGYEGIKWKRGRAGVSEARATSGAEQSPSATLLTGARSHGSYHKQGITPSFTHPGRHDNTQLRDAFPDISV